MTVSFDSVTHSCQCDLCLVTLNYLKANIPVSYAHCDRHKLFFVEYEFSLQCNTEGFCCGNPYKEEILLKVSLIAQLPGISFPLKSTSC